MWQLSSSDNPVRPFLPGLHPAQRDVSVLLDTSGSAAVKPQPHIELSLAGLERETRNCVRVGTVTTVSYAKCSAQEIANYSGFSPNLAL